MLLVTGNFAIDKCLAINKMYPEFVEPSHSYLSDLSFSHPKKILVPSYLPSPALAFSQLWKSFFTPEESLPYQRIQHFRGALNILKHASKSFHAASWMFPWDLRLDMAILYAFCRATDDLVDDDKLSKEDRLRNVNIVRALINSVYSTPERAASQRNVEAFCKQMKLPDWALDAACAFTFVSDAVPKENVLELVRGYEQDLVFKEIRNVEDLIDYSECVAGSVGAMCTHLLLNRTRDTDLDESKKQNIVLKAREMGLVSKTSNNFYSSHLPSFVQSLQLTNIARDILTDSVTLKRCYIPTSFFAKSTIHVKEALLQGAKGADTVDESIIRVYAMSILDLADDYYSRSVGAISELPASCRGGVRAACDVYREIASALRNTPGYRRRVYISKWRRIWIGLRSLYRQG
jgi:15-cis-phytoene synthase/lycopene beta-cyclase